MASPQVAHIEVDTGSQWRRLAPIALLYFIASNLRQTVQSALYIIPALAIGAQTSGWLNTAWLLPVGGAVVALILISSIVSYVFYQFRVRDSHVEIRRGLFNRVHTNLPFWRIQNVKVERPFYYRATRFAVVVLDTAGSAKEEAKIVAVTQHYAQALRTQILAEHDAPETDAESDTIDKPTDAQSGTVINTRSVRDLIIHGITNNRVWIVLGALAPFYDELANYVIAWLERQGWQPEQLVGSANVSWWQWGLYVFTLLMVIMALMAMVSVAGSLLTYYGYTLTRHGERYVRQSGLLSQQEVSVRRSRVQLVRIKQDWLDRVLGRANVFFEQNKTGYKQDHELMAPNKLLVPSVTLAQAAELSTEVLPGSEVFGQTYTRLSPLFLSHLWLVRLLPVATLAALVTILSDKLDLGLVVAAGTVLIAGMMYLRYRRWGLAYDADHVYVKKGLVGQVYQIFPLYKVQQVAVLQSVMMRRRQVASVRLTMASGSVTIPFLPQSQADTLARTVVHTVEHSARSWM